MKVQIDFQLNRTVGIVEKLVFRLVLNGFCYLNDIAQALPIFSDSVIANALKHLVNQQIIVVQKESGKLSISEPLIAIIEMCLEQCFEVEVPPEFEQDLQNKGLLVTNSIGEEAKQLKKVILAELIPQIRLDIYTDSLDFVLRANRGMRNE